MTQAKPQGMATIQQAADYLSCHRRTIERMLKDGQLPWKPVRARRRIPWTALKRLADCRAKAN